MTKKINSPSSLGVQIPGKRGKLLSFLYLPGGEYPKPVVMLCHGIPGKERLFDFAVAMREAGFCVVQFHYGGSWGSDGDYSVPHCFEDCVSVLDYIRRNENGWFDLSNVFIVGHSMGGLMACRTGAQQALVKGCAILAPMDFRIPGEEALGQRPPQYKDFIEEAATWLHGLSWESFRADAAEDLERFDLTTYAAALADKPVLTVAGELDALLPYADHVGRLNAAIEACGKGKLTKKKYVTDHGFNMERSQIKQDIVDFLLANST